ncbi:hypothetical protein [Aliikangiella maris]|uniref:Sel1 repeat family protein n=2 Tax=Aliikangiella maris TaxID=3162458 RepID=A0ABV3MQE8_9GAMM
MQKKIFIVILLISLAVISYFLLNKTETDSRLSQTAEEQFDEAEINPEVQPDVIQKKSITEELSVSELVENSQPLEDVYVPPVPLTEEEKALQEKFEKLGHFIPIEYYNYGLDTLKSLAENGDAYASFHLGERYYYQLLNDPTHADYDENMDYKAEARKAFDRALYLGNRHAAAVISELNMIEENQEDAYMWHLIAEDLGDSPATEWFKKQEFYETITEEHKLNAQTKYETLKQELKDRWINEGKISLL